MKLSAKSGVKIFGSRPEIIWCDIVVAGVYAEFNNAECIVTSATEGNHGDYSHHFKGFARDYRIWNIRLAWREKFVQRVRECLTDEFQVVLEKDHLHVEFDPKDGV